MLGMIIWIMVLVSLTGHRRMYRNFWYVVIGLLVFPYAVRFLLHVGIGLLPIILIALFLTNVAIPFIKGFLSRFKS